ncbi:hypothetical protein KP509_17G062300 [Ceratopteris richardii]|uniref:Tf2-1-like SH3-like domain-containing protein n=1 Tax=Ceratopteris richardii TaxID=49495 RepID=A0A8T2SYB3_CERRI|nr:hypothetical protein KP509_17G062300 [Ceratopteris richardii]
MSPFELATCNEVITPLALTQDSTLSTKDPDCEAFLDQWEMKLEEAKSSLQRSKECMARYANKKSARNITLPQNITHKFNHRYYGPYKVSKQINLITYQVELPNVAQFHNAFHLSLLKRFKPNTKYGCNVPVLQEVNNQFIPEAIMRDQNTHEGPQFLIKWKGRPLVDCEWISANTFGPDHPF